MSSLTVDLPSDLAQRLEPVSDRIPDILELGLRELNAASQSGFRGTAQVLEFLASLPSPNEILALHPTHELQTRVETLLEKNRSEGLSPAEEQEWEAYQFLEHLVRLAKAKAMLKLGRE